jgi:hypothetical protein
MNDQDLRDCFAMFALNGLLTEATGDYNDQAIAELSYTLADAMLKARKPKEEAGIVAVKRSPTKRRSNETK